MLEINPDAIRTNRCAVAFQRISWACLFLIDIRIGINDVYHNDIHLDLLPDFIGWLMIVSALKKILDLSSVIRRLQQLTYWVLFFSLFDVFEFRILIAQTGNVTRWISATFFITIISMILEIIIIWKLCELIKAMATTVHNNTIRQQAMLCRKLYLSAYLVAGLMTAMILFAEPSLVFATFLILLPLVIFIFYRVVKLLNGTATMCRNAIGY